MTHDEIKARILLATLKLCLASIGGKPEIIEGCINMLAAAIATMLNEEAARVLGLRPVTVATMLNAYREHEEATLEAPDDRLCKILVNFRLGDLRALDRATADGATAVGVKLGSAHAS